MEDTSSALPGFARSDLFPFDGDMCLKPVADPVLPEPPRGGEGGRECWVCAATDEKSIWVDDKWRLEIVDGLACPLVLSLAPREHYDSPDLPDDLAAELGVLLVRIERAILATGGIGRVHFSKWGDGGAHLHWWIMAREAGALQQRGSFLILWAQSLPPPPRDAVQHRAAAVVDELLRYGGRRPWASES